MKYSSKIFFFISIVSVLLSSCSNDKDDKSKFLKKVVETSADGTSTTTLLKYIGDEIVTIDGIELRTDFTYTNGLITKIRTTDKGTQLSQTVEYSYDTDQLIQVVSPNNYVINYIHNTDDTVFYEKRSLNSGSQEAKFYHGTLYFKDKNLIKDERILDDAAPGLVSKYTVNFQYDSKKNPFYPILGYSKLLDHNEVISSNNTVSSVVESSSTNAADQTISSAKFFNSTFKYDTDGYPTEELTETAKSGYLKSQYFY
jgi:hypothetical protein